MASETLMQNSAPAAPTALDNSAVAIDAVQKNLDAHISDHTQQLSNIEDTLSSLKENLIELSAKFDVWQSNTEPMLGQAYDTAQSAMEYYNYVLTATAVIIAIAGVFFQWWASKSKKEAISDAIKTIENTIAKGILPEQSNIRSKLIQSILNSKEFIEAVKTANSFNDNAEKAEKERASRGTLNISAQNITTAEITSEDENGTTDIDNHAKIEQEKNADSKGGNDEY